MKRTLAVLIAATFAAPVLATEPVVVFSHQLLAEAPSAQADAWRRWAEDYSNEMRASMGTMFAPRMGSSKMVKGAPYTAEVVTESTQTLPDGNTISRKKTGLIFRDGEGRTRQELGGDGKKSTIHINDPVEKRMYILTPGANKAIVVPSASAAPHAHAHAYAFDKDKHKHKQVVRAGSTEIRIDDGKVFVDGREVGTENAEFTSRSGKKIVVANGKVTIDGKDVGRYDIGPGASRTTQRVETVTSPDGTTREEVRIQVVRSGDGVAPVPPVPPTPPTPSLAPLPPMPPLPGLTTMRFETAKLGKGVTTSLGSREFDGVKAEGKSTVWTIAAGEIGNKNPINVTSESWYSPELQVTVMSRYNDPRTGETVYRLANIRRVEPAPDLFKVPEGYEVKGRGPKAKG